MSRRAVSLVPLCAALLAACGGGLQQPTPKDAEFAAARWPGTTLAQLGEGRSLYARRCGACHALYAPAERAEPDWRESLAENRRLERAACFTLTRRSGNRAMTSFTKTMMSLERPLMLVGSVALGALSFGCSDDDADGSERALRGAIETYAEIAHESYHDSADLAHELDAKIGELVDSPSAAALVAARTAWLAAREPYLQTEVFRFYGGPIDDEDEGVEGQINAWPLDESYIDYTVETGEVRNTGIVNDPSLTIDAETLIGKNEEGGEENIATGYHAIEFLLWGQDLSETGPGDRPYVDYDERAGGVENAARRALYLTTVSALLVEDLEKVAEAWEPGENYAKEFTSAPSKEALRRILTGMITLAGFETGGERLENAITTGEQNDEHSCFSDNTHRDMVQDVQGILNVWEGRYEGVAGESVTGPGIQDVVATRDGKLADEIDDQIRESLRLANALEPPFDNEIKPENTAGRARVEALSDSLRRLEGMLVDVFEAFALTVPEEPQ
jgi:putative iron-regulated protein